MRTIERAELRAKLERGDDFHLIMTMGPYAFAKAHIPGSVSFDDPEAGFASLGRNDDIVVYCSDPACIASRAAYEQFVERGFTNVRRYSGGLSDWQEAGLPLDGTG